MTQLLRVVPEFAVAGQLAPTELAAVAAAGFRTLICNRPDGEEPDQPGQAEMAAAAIDAGLRFAALPFAGAPPPPAVTAMARLLEGSPGPVLAYCRSGRRSILAWAMAQAFTGARRPDEAIALAAKAGYDLEGARGALLTLAPKS